jgi:muconolactone delta-isomerase
VAILEPLSKTGTKSYQGSFSLAEARQLIASTCSFTGPWLKSAIFGAAAVEVLEKKVPGVSPNKRVKKKLKNLAAHPTSGICQRGCLTIRYMLCLIIRFVLFLF